MNNNILKIKATKAEIEDLGLKGMVNKGDAVTVIKANAKTDKVHGQCAMCLHPSLKNPILFPYNRLVYGN